MELLLVVILAACLGFIGKEVMRASQEHGCAVGLGLLAFAVLIVFFVIGIYTGFTFEPVR